MLGIWLLVLWTLFILIFLNENTDCSAFCEEYAQHWKSERNSGGLRTDDVSISAALASIFCFVYLFNLVDDKEEYESNEDDLRLEISRIIGNGHLVVLP